MGCGSGLLSIMAARSGAGRVLACDLSDAMCNVTRRAVRLNGVADSVEVWACHSKDLRVGGGGDKDVGNRVDMVVTETADCGLLGERMISSLQHVQRELLQPVGLVEPCVISPLSQATLDAWMAASLSRSSVHLMLNMPLR